MFASQSQQVSTSYKIIFTINTLCIKLVFTHRVSAQNSVEARQLLNSTCRAALPEASPRRSYLHILYVTFILLLYPSYEDVELSSQDCFAKLQC